MAIQKAFVVKNSLEVDQKLLFVDSVTNKVGVGTSHPGSLLDVAGNISAENINVSGFGTFTTQLNVGPSGNALTVVGSGLVGINTNGPTEALDVRGNLKVSGIVSTNSLYAPYGYVGILTVFDNLDISGDTILNGNLTVNDGTTQVNNLFVAGISTVQGVIRPSTGISSSSGIFWAQNPGGGAGDEAFIRYYVKTGEDTRLHIGVRNDSGDELYLDSRSVGISSNLTVENILNVNNNTVLGINSSSRVSFNSLVNTNILPSTNSTLSLGSTGNKWATLYADNIVGQLTGNSDTATRLSVGNTISNQDHYLLFVGDSNVGVKTVITDSGLVYNPVSDLLNVSKLYVSGISTFIQNATFNSFVSFASTVGFTSTINTNLIPASGTLSIGSSTNKWDKVYANTYENFKFSDLPTSSEPTFLPDRVLKVKSDGTGYELVDILELNTYQLSGSGISNDGNVYVGIGSTVSNKIQISGISTVNFYVGQKVKVFGITSFTDNTLVDPPVTATSSASKVGTTASGSTYRYWISQYNLRNGKVGVSSQISPMAGIAMTTVDNFNDLEHIALTLSRTDTNHGILVYRQIGVTTNISDAKLIAILGPKELSNSTSGIVWKDYGTYEQTEWSTKGTVNEYNDNQIHFPNIATTGHRRGWAIDDIVSIGKSTITLSNQYTTNVGLGTTNTVKVVHDNTSAFSEAIDSAVAVGKNSLELPSGTYVVSKLVIPENFTIKGNGKNTVVKQQYFATDSTDGAGNALPFDGNMVGVGTTNPSNITIQDVTFDGNSGNNILFDGEIDNYLLYFENIESSLIKSVEVRNSPGHGVYVYNSRRLSIENSSVVDGSLTDRYSFQPLNAQESETLRINDSLFENYPGPVDLSVTSIVSVGGNIIRNCGTGLRTYATGKITTTNNLILGPADEWIPTPDIYDSDYNSVNFTVQRGVTFTGPVLLYLQNGSPKNISSTQVKIISAGIGTIVGQGTTNETLGTRFLNFNVITPDSGEFGRQNGYIQLSLTPSQTSTLGITSSLGYDIVAEEYLDVPIGFTTYIGIGTGSWNVIGAGATQYTVELNDYTQFSGISTGDVVKLVNHSVSPDLSSYELTVAEKIDVGASIKRVRLVGFTTTSIINGNQSGYISIRNTFTIAKGRVGVI